MEIYTFFSHIHIPLYHIQNCKFRQKLYKIIWHYHIKISNVCILQLSNLTPCYMPMRNSYTYVLGDMYNYFYTSTVQDGKALGKPKGPWMREEICKVWCIHTMEYYTEMKTKGSQLHATWMNLRKIKLTEKKKTCFKRLNMQYKNNLQSTNIWFNDICDKTFSKKAKE